MENLLNVLIVATIVMAPFVLHSWYVIIRNFVIWKLTYTYQWSVELKDISCWNDKRWRYRLRYDQAPACGWINAIVSTLIIKSLGSERSQAILEKATAKKLKESPAVVEAGAWQ